MQNTPCLGCVFLKQVEMLYICKAAHAELDEDIVMAVPKAINLLPDCPDFKRSNVKFDPNLEDVVVRISRQRRTTRATLELDRRNFLIQETEDELLAVIQKIHEETGKWPTHHQVFWMSRFKPSSEGTVYNVLAGMVEKGLLNKEPVKRGRYQFAYSVAVIGSVA